jgi:hypothetical protein
MKEKYKLVKCKFDTYLNHMIGHPSFANVFSLFLLVPTIVLLSLLMLVGIVGVPIAFLLEQLTV